MTLLKFIRNSAYGLSNDEIRTVIQDSELPNTWSAQDVSRFISRCPVDSLRESLQDSYHDFNRMSTIVIMLCIMMTAIHVMRAIIMFAIAVQMTIIIIHKNRDTYIHNEDYDEYDSDYDDENYSGVYRYETNVLDHLEFQCTPNELQQQKQR